MRLLTLHQFKPTGCHKSQIRARIYELCFEKNRFTLIKEYFLPRFILNEIWMFKNTTETDCNKIMFAIILGKLEFKNAYNKTETDPQNY